MGEVIKKLNDMDRVLPELKVYKFIVLMLLAFNLVGLGILLYNQYTSQYIPAPVILTQKGGSASYDMCVNYYEQQCEKYKPSVVEDEETDEDNKDEALTGGFMDDARGIRSDLTPDPTTGVLDDPVVSADSETGGFMMSFEGSTCDLGAKLLYAEYEGTLSEWLEVNYPESVATMLDYQVLDDDAYMLVDEDGYTHYLYMVNTEVADLWALPVDPQECDTDSADLSPTLEALLQNMEYVLVENEELDS